MNFSKFAAPGRIAFRNASPAPVAVLVSPYGAAEISLYGAHLLSYRPTGQSPVLWLAESYKTLQPSKAIRGGIPVCWPWFGAAALPDLPSHGFARTQIWEVNSTEYDKETTTLILILRDSLETRELWPHNFRLQLKITVGPSLELELSTTNTDTSPFEITEALHSYFRVKDIATTTVTGLDNQPYLNKVANGSDGLQSGAITFTDETDRIYNHHDSAALITDEALNRRIAVEKTGSHATVVWNPWIEKAQRLTDMHDDDWHNFVCVETANAGTAPIIVEPRATHTITAKITSALLSAQ